LMIKLTFQLVSVTLSVTPNPNFRPQVYMWFAWCDNTWTLVPVELDRLPRVVRYFPKHVITWRHKTP
jgi:hypothetical protein